MNKESVRKFWIITIFAIAMGFLETAVVVFTRELYYKAGFNFPLATYINPLVFNVELAREFATIVMLAMIGWLASKKAYEKFAYFIYAFAVWDIFYYIFLKVTLNWPASLLTWDLLFLIPWAWIGPVIAPVICSALFIILAVMIVHYSDKGKKIKFSLVEWVLFILGGITVLWTWLYDYGKLLFTGSAGEIAKYVPISYNWILFSIGILLVCIGIFSFYRRYKK